MNEIGIFISHQAIKLKQGNMKMQLKLARELNELYVEYYNDFLTVECYARYKGYRLDFTKAVINAGRKINRNQKLLNTIYA